MIRRNIARIECAWASKSVTFVGFYLKLNAGRQELSVKTIKLVLVVVSATIAGGCGGQAGTNSSSLNLNANTTQNTASANTAKVEATPSQPPDRTSGASLATPTEAYKTAHEMRKNKDVAGLKSIMTSDVKEFLTMMGEDQKKSLDDMIEEMCDKPQADKAVARNEKIKGDKATVEYLTETGAWKTMDFEKVEGKWLMSLPSADGPSPEK